LEWHAYQRGNGIGKLLREIVGALPGAGGRCEGGEEKHGQGTKSMLRYGMGP
jgi:hypothetical protein